VTNPIEILGEQLNGVETLLVELLHVCKSNAPPVNPKKNYQQFSKFQD
jgi:hypothetical protein